MNAVNSSLHTPRSRRMHLRNCLAVRWSIVLAPGDCSALRWVLYDKVRLGAHIPEHVELIHQERAYTSPIWYSP